MPGFLSKLLSSGTPESEIETLERRVLREAQSGQPEVVWQSLLPLREAQRHQQEAAQALLRIVREDCLTRERALELLSEIAEFHAADASIMATLGGCLEAARDMDDLNAAPPAGPVFRTTVERLAAFAQDFAGKPEEEAILEGLAHAARLVGRQYDEIAEKSYRKLAGIAPGQPAGYFNLGLFCKTRGLFEEGMKANQTAIGLMDEVPEAYSWNLGICATGAGRGAVALDVWKGIGQKLEIGRFGLPEGGYPQCKVKLAERPLAERTAETDDPGEEETIWIERLSPCHGIVRSVLYGELGVDYGDVILIDGAPVTFHNYDGTQIAVFPHLATLVRRNYQFYDFAGTQENARQLVELSRDLDEDAVVYSHSESFRQLCADCWRDPGVNHQSHESVEKHIVFGRIAAPPHMEPAKLLEQLDKAMASRLGCQIYVPDLCTAAGLEERAAIEGRRFGLLADN